MHATQEESMCFIDDHNGNDNATNNFELHHVKIQKQYKFIDKNAFKNSNNEMFIFYQSYDDTTNKSSASLLLMIIFFENVMAITTNAKLQLTKKTNNLFK